MKFFKGLTVLCVTCLAGGLALYFVWHGSLECKCPVSISLSSLAHEKNLVDTVIFGSGPAGTAAASWASRGGFKTIVLHGPLPGGQLTETTYVDNWPGSKRVMGPQIMERFHRQAKSFPGMHLVALVSVSTRMPMPVTTFRQTTIRW